MPAADPKLDSRHIIDTARRLRERIDERFPGSGLGKVAGQVWQEAEEADATMGALVRPIWKIRAFTVAVLAAMLGILIVLVGNLRWRLPAQDIEVFIQFLESALASLVFLGAFVLFLVGLENRFRRHAALAELHQLRSLAHIIDMHQLTKDPERLNVEHADTASSPKQALNAFHLGRYLDYCGELLSILSKIGALWSQRFDDPEVLRSVDQIENLTTGLTQKIWQKLVIISRSG